MTSRQREKQNGEQNYFEIFSGALQEPRRGIIHPRPRGGALPLRRRLLSTAAAPPPSPPTQKRRRRLGSWRAAHRSQSSSSSSTSPTPIPFVYLVVIQTLVWIFSCIRLYSHIPSILLLWCWSHSCMSSSFVLGEIWRNPSNIMMWNKDEL